MILPDKKMGWPNSYEAVLETARFEGCRLRAYRDIVEVSIIWWVR